MDDKVKTAVVTGASSGMGRDIAIRLAGKGFRVIAAARRKERLEELAAQNQGIVPRQVDLSDVEDREKFCRYLSDQEEPVSVLVNNAGYSIRGAVEDVPIKDAQRLFEVNVFALIRVTQACLPGMRALRGGTIVNLSSMAGKFAFPMSGVYAATKHAVEAISDALRIEVLPFGIRVIAIRPGFIATEFNDVANEMTGDLLARTDPEYKPLYQASGAGIGKLFVNAVVPGPELIGEIVLEAILSDNPKTAYFGGFMSGEFMEKRTSLDDDAFDRYLSEITGLADLKV